MIAAPIHPFPARMAPHLALDVIRQFEHRSLVLDPMSGSGTVARHAVEHGHDAIGFDLDPLAVLIADVWTSTVCAERLDFTFRRIMAEALGADPESISLPWIDKNPHTQEFVEYWFGRRQARDLRCISYALANARDICGNDFCAKSVDVLKVALSRIIVTKDQCASLARDTSHSRPHKVTQSSDYDVFSGFVRSVSFVRKRLALIKTKGNAKISCGDARKIDLNDECIDYVITSPPYLNAIDYLRGHKFSLIWLGFAIEELTKIRSTSIGAERKLDQSAVDYTNITDQMADISVLPNRYQGMIKRYAADIYGMIKEVHRVLKPGGHCQLVVGNSCLRGVFISNSNAIEYAGVAAGLSVIGKTERELPIQNRYLPTPDQGQLSKRMRTESIIAMVKH